ncbi:MAG: FAD-dependent monooxygenase [Rickettsiales bacterium]|nr:FAD-dependent monooxygenase [Rickettsiales bacterium]
MTEEAVCKKFFDIIIVGGSFSGLTTAISIANIDKKIKIAVIDRQDFLNKERPNDGKALAISNHSINFLKQISAISNQLLENSAPILDIKITDNQSPITLDFIGSKNSNDNSFGFIISSFDLYNQLKERALKLDNIEFICPVFYQKIDFFPNENNIYLDNGLILNAKLLIACDGRDSNIRKLCNINIIEKTYHQTAIIFNINHQVSHQYSAWEHFFTGGPLAILPLKDTNNSAIVWIVPNSKAEILLKLDEENFITQLQKKLKNHLGKIQIISKKFIYPLNLIESESLFYNHAMLIGDSAFGLHPIAGQGFNLSICGIETFYNLVKNSSAFITEDFDNSLILEHQKQFKKIAKKMIIATDLINSIFESDNLILKASRKMGIFAIDKIEYLKKFFIKNAGGY